MTAVLSRSDFYHSGGFLHPLVVGSIILCVVFIYLRMASNRTLAPISIFSHLCIFVLGSSISRILTQPDVNLARGLLSIAVLLSFEYISTTLSARFPRPFAKWFASRPLLLLFRGKILDDVMQRNRVSPFGLYQAMRQAGYARADQLEAIILEGNGTFSCIKRLHLGEVAEALEVVRSYRDMCEKTELQQLEIKHNNTSRAPPKHISMHMEHQYNGTTSPLSVPTTPISEVTRVGGIH